VGTEAVTDARAGNRRRSKPAAVPLRPIGMRSVMLVALALTTSCGGTVDQALPPTSSPTPSTHDLVVSQSYESGPGGVLYIEGAIAELVISSEQGPAQAVQGDPDRPITLSGLSPGDYTVKAALRPCNANCGNLTDPVDSCATSMSVPQTTRLTVRYVLAQPCVIEAE
jgi:hypothetical protein